MRNRLPILFLFLVLISIQTLFAQIQKVDSLENVLSHHHSNNSKRVDIMNEIAYLTHSNDPQKAMKYVSESARLSDRLNYRKGKAVSLWITGLVHCRSDAQIAVKYLQQGLAIAEDIEDQVVICNCLIAIGNMQKKLGEIDKCDEAYERAFKIANEIKDKNLLLKCLINIALNHNRKGEYVKSVEILKESIQLAQELKENSILSKAFNNLAWIYSTWKKR